VRRLADSTERASASTNADRITVTSFEHSISPGDEDP